MDRGGPCFRIGATHTGTADTDKVSRHLEQSATYTGTGDSSTHVLVSDTDPRTTDRSTYRHTDPKTSDAYVGADGAAASSSVASSINAVRRSADLPEISSTRGGRPRYRCSQWWPGVDI
jgi:hypothetical protein